MSILLSWVKNGVLVIRCFIQPQNCWNWLMTKRQEQIPDKKTGTGCCVEEGDAEVPRVIGYQYSAPLLDDIFNVKIIRYTKYICSA